MPGAGKSTLGRLLATKINIPFFDLDQIIIEFEGKSIPEIFESQGEDYFRKIENQSLNRIVSEKKELVLACGGGTPCFFDNIDFMNRSGITIFLDVDVADLELRLHKNDDRPLLQGGDLTENIDKLYYSRKSFYEKAKIVITQNDDLNSIIEKIDLL